MLKWTRAASVVLSQETAPRNYPNDDTKIRFPRMKRVKDLAEKKLIERLNGLVTISTNDLLAKYDDVFYLESRGRSNVVVHADMLIGKTDIPAVMDYYHVGVKAVIMNVSDLIVKGVVPRGMVVSLGIPGNMFLKNFDKLIQGIGQTSQNYGIQYLGGDLNEADDVIVDIMMIGFHEEALVPRKGIKPSNIVATTGEFGFTTSGLHLVLNGLEKDADVKYQPCLDAVLRPTLNYDAILNIARKQGVVASIDSSDGLASSLLDLMDVNECGFLIDSMKPNPILEEFSTEYHVSVPDLLFNGGEEYHAIFIIDDQKWPEIKADASKNNFYLQKIGHVIQEKKVLFKEHGSKELKEITKRGYEHFSPHVL
ncbi:MAG TPA: thiamine-phosphate kinase [Candidatus Lokiarchaeia archaeon]|nr:thiamine-phosphate kinase [Candidatus Lokiarchaeia archaeon]